MSEVDVERPFMRRAGLGNPELEVEPERHVERDSDGRKGVFLNKVTVYRRENI
jgi:hypothetical protein